MRVLTVTESDADDVICLLKHSFFPHEPLNASIGLCGPDGCCAELEDYCRAVLPCGLSLSAVDDDSGELMGVVLNGVLDRAAAGHTAIPPSPDASKFEKILSVNAAAESAADVFALYPDADRILDVKILATHPSHTRKGVAGALITKTLDIARSRGFVAARCVCSGAFSARAAQLAGFTCLAELRYDAFLDNTGRPVVSPDPPHTAITTWGMRL